MALVKRTGKVYNHLECGTCKKRFWMTCAYLDHMSTQGHFSFSCNICNKVFSDQKQLDTHYITHKEVTNTYDCKQCPRKFLQKNQLEQHMRFHFTFLSPKESSLSPKKAVHFSSILESRTISDESSYSDSDFDEDYKLSTTKTRSGRIIKAKKMFDDTPVLKRRRKSSNELLKRDSKNAEQPLKLRTPDETNFTTEKLTSASSSTSSDEVFNKKLVVLVDKLPESVYKNCVATGNICDLGSTSNQKLINPLVNSNSQINVLNHRSEAVSKSFPAVISSDLPRNLSHNNSKVTDVSSHPQSNVASNCSQRVNIATASKKLVYNERTDEAKTNTSSKSNAISYKNLSHNNSKVTDVSSHPQSPLASNCSQRVNIATASKRLVYNEIITDETETNTSSTSNAISYKNSNIVVSISTLQSPVVSAEEHRFLDEINSSLNIPHFPNKTNTVSCYYTSPQVKKEFLYVGPNQDMKKIQNIIEELKTKPNYDLQTSESKLVAKANSSRLSQDISIENPSNVGNLNVNTQNKDLSEGTGYEHELTNGILGKTVLDNVILIKVTPELMQKMQKATLSASESHRNLDSLDTTTVLPVCSKDLNQVSQIIEGNEMSELVQSETLQSGQENFESFSTAKPANISSVSFSVNKNLSPISHVAEKHKTPELMPTVHSETLVSSQTSKPANISSVSFSVNKNLSQISHVAEKHKTPELMPTVHSETLVSSQKGNENSISFSAYKAPNISPIPFSLKKNSSKVSRLTDKNGKPELMQKVHKKTSVPKKRGHKNLKSFSTVKNVNISSLSCSVNEDISETSQVVDKNKTPNIMQKGQKKNLICPQEEFGNLKSFSAVKTINTSSVSSSMNKKLSRVPHITEKHEKLELMQKVCRKTSQEKCKNFKSLIASKPANTSESSSEDNDSTEVSQLRDKSKTSELMQNVQKKNLIFPQMGHGNSESFSSIKTANTSSVSYTMNKKLSKVSHITEKYRKPGLIQKEQKKTLVPLQKGHKKLNVFIVDPANISRVTSMKNKDSTKASRSIEKNRLMQKMCKPKVPLQRACGNIEPSSTVMPVNISSLSASLNKDLTESTEKNKILPKVINAIEVSQQKGHGNLVPSSVVLPVNVSQASCSLIKTASGISPATAIKGLVTELPMQRTLGNLEPSNMIMSANISPVSSTLNKNLTEVSQPIGQNNLKKKVKRKAQRSHKQKHVNLEPSSGIMPVNISPVPSHLNKGLTEVSQLTETNIVIQNVRSAAQVSLQKGQRNSEPSYTVMSSNISPVSSCLNKDLTQASQSTEKNIVIQDVRSEAQVSLQEGHKNSKPVSTVMSENICPVSSSLNKDRTEVSQSAQRNIIIQNVKSEAEVFLQREQENLEPSSGVMSSNLSPVSSHLNKDLTEVSQSTEKSILVQTVKSETQVSQQTDHENLEPCTVVLSTNISPGSCSLNKDLTKVSQSTEKNEMSELLQIIKRESPQKKHKNLESFQTKQLINISSVSSSLTHDSKIADKSVKGQAVNCETSETLSISQVTSNATLRKRAKIPEQNIESSLLIDKKYAGTASSQLERPNSSREEKLLARYKAKIEEKERKKREKYELKKRMRYMEKIKCGINPNLTELMQVFKEAHSESSTLARNLEGDAKLPLQSKTKSFATEIVSDVKKKKSISTVNNTNLATTSARSKKHPRKK